MKQINAYSFDELPLNVQNKVIETFQQNEDFPFLSEDLTEYLNILLKQKHIKGKATLSYDFGGSYEYALFCGTFEHNGILIKVEERSNVPFYSFCDAEKKVTPKKEEAFKNVYLGICEQLKTHGGLIINETLNPKNIIEMIKTNKYSFLADGRQV
jgi:hypothetical protein